MFHFSRKAKIFIGFLIIVVGGYFASSLLWGSSAVPADFEDARLQGALIAENIIRLSSESANDLARVNKLEGERKFSEALDITSRMLTQSQEIRAQAVDLSKEIERMTLALPSIRPVGAQQAALSAITDRLALISRLINYSAGLEQLLGALRGRFMGYPGNHQVQNIIEQINNEVTAINHFNSEAVKEMEKFDSLIAR